MEKAPNHGAAVLVSEHEQSSIEQLVCSKGGTTSDANDMSRMGKKQQLRRNFNFFSIWAFAMILMSTWEAWLGTVAFGLGNGGTAGMLYMYIIVCALFLLVIFSMSEMASMAPTAGGQYHWVSEFAPSHLQKQLSYFVGWLCVLGWQSGSAIGCFLAATEIQGLVILNHESYAPQRWHGTLLSIGVILFVAIFNTFLARYLPHVESLVLFLHLAGFLAIITTLWTLGDRGQSKEIWTRFDNAGNWSSTGVACLVGMISPIISLIGADAATHMSEELKNASKTLPKAMIATAVFNGTLGLIMVITFCYNVGDVERVLTTRTGFPFIQVFYDVTGSKAGATVMTCILVLLATANGMTNMATASRQLFAFARDNGVPFSTWFARVPNGWDVPLNAIIFTIVFSSMLTLINIGSSIAFNQINSLGLCALLTSYIVSIGSVAYRRMSGQVLLGSRFSLGRWGLPINLVSIGFLAVAIVMSFFPPLVNPTLETMNWAVVVYTGVLAIAAVHYIFWGRFVYVGPVEYVRKTA